LNVGSSLGAGSIQGAKNEFPLGISKRLKVPALCCEFGGAASDKGIQALADLVSVVEVDCSNADHVGFSKCGLKFFLCPAANRAFARGQSVEPVVIRIKMFPTG
jgi:hypothetical protein